MIKYKIDIIAALKDAGYTTYKLYSNNIINGRILQNIRAGKIVRESTLNTLCRLLQCQPGDLLEYTPDE